MIALFLIVIALSVGKLLFFSFKMMVRKIHRILPAVYRSSADYIIG